MFKQWLKFKDLDGGYNVDTDDVVGVSSEESGSIGRPCQTGAGRHFSELWGFGSKSVDNDLWFQIPDLDGIIGGGTQPVSVGAEDQPVDDVTGIQAVQSLSFVEVPEHRGIVLTSGSGQGSIGTDTDSVQVSGVSDEVVSELAVGQVPDLDKFVPPATDNKRNRLGRRESDARNPFGVALAFGVVSADRVLAFSEGVPETDGSITGS